MLGQSILLVLSLYGVSGSLGPFQGLRAKDTPHFQDPSCVEFTLQVKGNKFMMLRSRKKHMKKACKTFEESLELL